MSQHKKSSKPNATEPTGTDPKSISAMSAAEAVDAVLKGGHGSIAEAFAQDRRMLEKLAKAHGDTTANSHAWMAGSSKGR